MDRILLLCSKLSIIFGSFSPIRVKFYSVIFMVVFLSWRTFTLNPRSWQLETSIGKEAIMTIPDSSFLNSPSIFFLSQASWKKALIFLRIFTFINTFNNSSSTRQQTFLALISVIISFGFNIFFLIPLGVLEIQSGLILNLAYLVCKPALHSLVKSFSQLIALVVQYIIQSRKNRPKKGKYRTKFVLS